jgi:site-specific recombinase XerD
MLFVMKVHPKIVQELLGHNQISMTMDIYSHVIPSMQEDVIHKFNEAFQPKEDEEEREDSEE